MALSQADREKIAKLGRWKERNPLRLWRIENNITLSEASVILGVSVTSITGWEAGSTMPSAESFHKMRQHIGDNLQNKWNTWWREMKQ